MSMPTQSTPERKPQPKMSPELRAMVQIERIIEGMEEESQERVTDWVFQRYSLTVKADRLAEKLADHLQKFCRLPVPVSANGEPVKE